MKESDRDPMKVELVQLVRDHHNALFRCAYRLCGSFADAEDLTQQTFLIARQKLHQLRDHAKASSWLFTVLRNCYLRDRRRNVPVPATQVGLNLDRVGNGAEVDGEVDSEMLQRALDELPDEFRLVLVMFYFQHLSYKQIAEELELRPGTVMSRLSRAKARLRQKLTIVDSQHERTHEQSSSNGRSVADRSSNSRDTANRSRASSAPTEVQSHG